MANKLIVKYLDPNTGKYEFATVADIGDLDKLKTTVKTDIVSAINSIQLTGTGNNDALQQQLDEINKLLNEYGNNLTDEQKKVIEDLIGNISDNLEDRIKEVKDKAEEDRKTVADLITSVNSRFENAESDYIEKVNTINESLDDAKSSIENAKIELENTKNKLNTIDLNYIAVEKNIDEINGVLSTKVDSTDFDLLDSTVTQNTTDLIQTKKDISLKANQASLDLVTDRVQKAEASLEITAGQIQQKVTYSEMQDELEKVGKYGKNLLKGTRNWKNWISSDLLKATVTIDDYRHCKIAEFSTRNSYFEYILDEDIEVGETYAASINFKSDIEDNLVAVDFHEENNVYPLEEVVEDVSTLNGWKRMFVKFVATDPNPVISFRFSFLPNGAVGYMSAPKLEKGSKATDWESNAEDDNNAIVEANSIIKQNADSIIQAVEKIEKTQDDIVETNSRIDITNENIKLQTQRIEDIGGEVKENKANLEITSNAIKTKVSQTDVDKSISDIHIDNKNRILNSDFSRDFENWNENGGFQLKTINDINYAYISRKGTSAENIVSIASDKFKVDYGARLIFGFDIFVENLSEYDIRTPIILEIFDINDIRVDMQKFSLESLNGSIEQGVSSRLNGVYEIDREDASKARVRLCLNKNGSIGFSRIIFQAGDISSTDWSAAPEDSQIIQSKLETAIDQTVDQIKLSATKEELNKVNGKVEGSIAELKIASDSIETLVSDTKDNTTRISKLTQKSDEFSVLIGEMDEDLGVHENEIAQLKISKNEIDIGISSVQESLQVVENNVNRTQELVDKANNTILEMSKDTILSSIEKTTTSKEWSTIKSDYLLVKAQGEKYDVDINSLNAKYSALSSYITPILANMNSNSTIVPSTFQLNFKNYYDEKLNVLNKVNDKINKNIDIAKAESITASKTYTDSQISVKSDEINLGVKTVEEKTKKVSDDLSNLTIGGRNLLINTASPTATKLPSLTGSTPSIRQSQSLSINDGAVRISKVADSTEEVYYRFMSTSASNLASTPLVGGAAYTLSLDVRANLTNSNKLKFRAQYKLATESWIYLPEWDGSTFISGINGNTFTRVSSTFTLPEGATTLYFSLQMYDNTGLTPTNGNWFEFKNAKLEKGNKPTDWTPAPEDMAEDIQKAQTSADTANNTLTEISKDTILSAVEKGSVAKEWATIQSDYVTVKGQGDKYSVSTTSLTTAYNTLNTYITPLLANKTTNSTIVPATFQATFKNYYDAKLIVINAVNDVLNAGVNRVSRDLANTTISSVNLWIEKDSVTGYVNTTGAIFTNTTAVHRTMQTLVPIRDTSVKLLVQTWNPNLVVNTTNTNRVAFFDTNQKFISIIGLTGLTKGTSYNLQEIEIPTTASFMRFGVIKGNSSGVVDSSIKFKFELATKPTDYTEAKEDSKLYTSWSNDPNGADMVRVYPNENLALNTEFTPIVFYRPVTGATTSLNSILQSDGWHRISLRTDGVNSQTEILPVPNRWYTLKSGVTYTQSILVRTDATYNSSLINQFSWFTNEDSHNRQNAKTEYLGNNIYRISGSLTPTKEMNLRLFDSYFTAFQYHTTGTYMDFKYEKLEIGSEATAWTSSPTEDPVKAEMAYVGYSPKDSSDPSDYTWSENSKAKGTFKRWSNDLGGSTDMSSVEPNTNLITNSKSLSDYFASATIWTRQETDLAGFYMLNIVTTNNTSWQESRVPLSSTYGNLNGKVTVSFEYKNSVTGLLWTSIGAYNGATRVAELSNTSIDADSVYQCTPLGNGWTKAVGVFDTTAIEGVTNAKTYWLQFKKVSNLAGNASVRKVKVEKGENKSALYTSSYEEDPVRSVAQYIGIGSKDTINPADFAWSENPRVSDISAQIANDSITEMSKDSVLSAVEKGSVAKEWATIQSDYPLVKAQGLKYGTSLTTLNSTYSALSSYITPLLANMTQNSGIVPATFRLMFKNYYDAKLAIMGDVNDIINVSVETSKNEAITTSKTYTDSAIKIAKDSINIGVNELTESVTKVTKDLNDLSIGGRNYFLGTSTSVTVTGNAGANQTTTASNYMFSQSLKSFSKSGDKFILSATIDITGSGFAGTIRPQTAPNGYWATLSTPISVNKAETLNFSTAVTINQSMLDAPNTMIQFRFDNIPTTVKMTFTNVKFEKGTKQTDWSPAPEEVDKAISTSLETSKTYTDSAIKIAKDSIDIGVNETSETVKSITTSISKLVNMFPDPDLKKQTPKPTVESGVTATYDASGLVISNTGANKARAYWGVAPISLTIGKTYTVKAYVNSGGSGDIEIGSAGGENISATTTNSNPFWLEGSIKCTNYTAFSIYVQAGKSFRIRELYVYEGSGVTNQEILNSFEASKTYADARIKVTKEAIDLTVSKKVEQTQVDASILENKKILDTRATNQLPSWYYTNYPKQKVEEFKQLSSIGLSSITSGTYCKLETDVPWIDTTGGKVNQIAFCDVANYQRFSTSDSVWGAWVKIADANDVSNAISTSKTYADAQIKIAKDAIDLGVKEVKETTTKVSDSLNNLKLSQRNLILDSHKDYSNTNYLINQYKLDEEWVAGEQYTFVVKGTLGATTQLFGVWMNGGSSNVGYARDLYSTGIYYFTFTATTPVQEHKRTLNLYNYPNNTTTATVDWVALYKGNKPFDWTPALGDAMLYTAWSNKEDGSVDFTRNYPNENLINLSTMTLGKFVYWPGNGLSTNVARAVSDYIPVKEGEQYTLSLSANNGFDFSFYLYKDNTSGISDLRFNGGSWQTPDTNGSTFGTPKTTLAIPTGYKYARVSVIKNTTPITTDILKELKPKMELGTVDTPYTVSPQDDPIKAEMAYIGYSAKDSNDPKDYVWSENPKAKGTFKRWANSSDGKVDFTRTYPNENLITNSKTLTDYSASVWTRKATDIEGFYMLDISTTNNTSWQESRVLLSPEYGTLTGQVTVSFEYKNSVRDLLWTNIGAYNGDSRLKEIDNVSVDNNPVYVCTVLPNGWTKAVGVFDVSNLANVSANAYWLQFKKVSTKSGNISVRKIKVELGSNTNAIYTSSSEEDSLLAIPQYVGIGVKDSDNPADFVWSMSPEYTQALNEVSVKEVRLQLTPDSIYGMVGESSEFIAWQDVMASKPSIDDLMNVQDQLDGLSNADETILASVADLEIANNGVLTTLNTAVREMDGTLNTISDYMFFGKSSLTGTVGLTIGKSDSNMKVNIANDEMGFYDNETRIAWINSQQLNITSAVIQNDIKVGNHLIEKFNDAEQITIVRYMGS